MAEQQVELTLDYKDLKHMDWTWRWLMKFSYDLCIRKPWLPFPLTGKREFANRQHFMNQRDREGRTALFAAIRSKKYSLAVLLLSCKCDVRLSKTNKTNCLHMAAALGDLDFIPHLLNRGLHVDAKDSGDRTAILIATRFGNMDTVRELIKSNCNLHIPDEHGFFPIHYAVLGCFDTLVEAICDENNDEDDHPITSFGLTPLMLAFDPRHNGCDCACYNTLLLDEKCPYVEFLPVDRLLFGGNIIHHAVDSGCIMCVQKLIDPNSKCSVNSPNWMEFADLSGLSCLILAVLKGFVPVVCVILQYATVIDISPWSTNSFVLHVAAAKLDWQMVQILCEDERLQPLINRRDCFGDTPLSLAYRAANESNPPNGMERITKTIRYLIKHGAICPHCDLLRRCRCGRYLPPRLPNYDKKGRDTRYKFHDSLVCAKSAGEIFWEFSSPSFPIENWFTHSPVFKIYSPFRMALIQPKSRTYLGSDYLIYKYLSESQIGEIINCDASFKSCYLRGCREFIREEMPGYERTALSLQELCRGFIRCRFGYRADEKVRLLSVSSDIKDFLNMQELDEFRDEFNFRTKYGINYAAESSLIPSDAIDINDVDILKALECRRDDIDKLWI